MAIEQGNGIVAWVKRRIWLVATVMAIAVLAGGVTYVKFFRELPAPAFASDEEHFLFGSIGTEAEGVPYWIWLVLPRVFPDLLPRPGGYAALGLIGKDGQEMPIGLSKVTIGVPRVGINCALCHTARWRNRPLAPPTIVPAGPAHQTGAQEYLRFLSACASDPRFTASTLLGEIAKNYRLSLVDRLLYRFVIIPSTRRQLQRQQQARQWMAARPKWGRGRTDWVNPVKFSLLRQPVDATVGNADMMPVWNLTRHAGMGLQWDGANLNLKEMVLSSAVGAGATLAWVDRDLRQWDSTDPDRRSSLRRIQDYIGAAPSPNYPFTIDEPQARQGALIFARECAACHAFGGSRTGSVLPVTEVGTDRHRLDAWTVDAATADNTYGAGHAWQFAGFQKTDGYVSPPLDGLWLRAPYLHNGSVPTLADLLEAAEARPRTFWRGDDVYDPAKIGFVSSGLDAERIGTFYDTAEPGNSSAGHPYGTALPLGEKRALLEFLKTQ
jgi:mono/diheme cytochrome c family protein